MTRTKKKTAFQKKQEAWSMVCDIAEFKPLQWNHDDMLDKLMELVDQANNIINQPTWGTKLPD